jgi:hypothetical protein
VRSAKSTAKGSVAEHAGKIIARACRKVNICRLWEHAEQKSGSHAQVQEISDGDDSTASSMSPSPCCLDRVSQHRVSGLSDRGEWKWKGSIGTMKGSLQK